MAASAPVIRIERAHKLYREGVHDEALALYSEALSVARSKAQRIALHSNRAACYLKLRDFKMAAEECSSVLELDQEHTGALMLRVQILVALKDYQSALFDVTRLTEIDPSSDVYVNLHARLKTQLSLAPIPEADEEAFAHDREREETEEEETEDRKKENELINPTKKLSQMSPESKVPGRTRNPESQSTWIQKAERISESKNASNPAAECSKALEKAAELKGRYGLDYSRWDNVDDDSSDTDENEDDDEEPQYRFRIRTL